MPTRASCIAIALIVAAAPAFAASIHLRTADGTWVEVPAEQRDGAVGFTIGADQTDAGRALVVINRPDWMVLDDETPPRAVGYVLGDHEGEVDAEVLDLGGISEAATELVIEVADDDNPLDPQSARLRVEGVPQVDLTLIEEDREARRARFGIDLGALGPGAYEATFEVSDLAPLANTLSLPLRFSLAGVEISKDGQTIALSGGGAGFTVRGDRRETIGVDATDVAAFITLQPEGEKHLYVREFASVEELGRQGDWRLIEAEAALISIDDEQVTAEEVGARLSFRLALHPEIPALVVTSRATNLGEERSIYSFWGWLPADGYVTPDGEHHEWSMSYREIGPAGWVYLPRRGEDRPGVGWVSDGVFGESRFGTMLIYSHPQRPVAATGESVEITFAIMPAADPEEVRAVAERLVQEGALELPR